MTNVISLWQIFAEILHLSLFLSCLSERFWLIHWKLTEHNFIMQQALKCKLNTRLLRLRCSDTSMTGHESHESRGENVGEFLTSVERGLTIIGSSRYLWETWYIGQSARPGPGRRRAEWVSCVEWLLLTRVWIMQHCRLITFSSCMNHATLQIDHF